jgi:hypothetical protein
MPYLRCWRLRRATNNLFWRHIEHGLKPEQHHAKGNQAKPVNLTEFPEKSRELPPVSYKQRPFFCVQRFHDVAALRLKKCARSITIPITSST